MASFRVQHSVYSFFKSGKFKENLHVFVCDFLFDTEV